MSRIKKGSNSFEGWWQGAVLGASDGRLWNAALRLFPGERLRQRWTPFTPVPLQTYLDDKMCYWCSPEGESRRVPVDKLISLSRTHTLALRILWCFQAFRLLNHCRHWLKGVRQTWHNKEPGWCFPPLEEQRTLPESCPSILPVLSSWDQPQNECTPQSVYARTKVHVWVRTYYKA